MFPWLWLWAPQVHLPWSGNVAQRIDPDTRWFFQGIPRGAGDASIEEKAFSVASYGKQLGLITEILIDLADKANSSSGRSAESLARLKSIRDDIERIKAAELGDMAEHLEATVAELRRKGGPEFAALARRLLPLLG